MTQNNRSIFIITLITLCGFVLTSCGGGSGSSSTTAKTETINGITVPVPPDPVANNATLAGVDSNNNGVRDDVERSIASDSIDRAQFDAKTLIAKEFQTILISPSITNDDIKTSSKKIACTVINNKGLIKDSAIRTMIVNSDIRKSDMRSKLSRAGGFAIEDGDCK